jgi:hypothetical protein
MSDNQFSYKQLKQSILQLANSTSNCIIREVNNISH